MKYGCVYRSNRVVDYINRVVHRSNGCIKVKNRTVDSKNTVVDYINRAVYRSNSGVDVNNGTVDRFNGGIESKNRAVDSVNRVVEYSNRTVDRLNRDYWRYFSFLGIKKPDRIIELLQIYWAFFFCTTRTNLKLMAVLYCWLDFLNTPKI